MKIGVFFLTKQPRNICDNGTDNHTAHRRDNERQNRPFPAACFFFYRQQRGGAGKVHKRENYHAQRSHGRPTVCRKQIKHLCGGNLRETALLHIGHHDKRDNDFIRGKSEQKCRHDNAVHSDKPSKRVKKARNAVQQRSIADGNIREQPDRQSRGSRDRRRSAKHKYCPVEQRAHQYLAKLRLTERRQLQRERRRLAAQYRRREYL